MSDQAERRMLTEAAAIQTPLRRLADAATDAAQVNWEQARWHRYEAPQTVFDSCQQLQRAIEDAERALAQPPPTQPQRKKR